MPALMKHDTEENAAITRANTILRCQVGSRLHGVMLDDSDCDEMALVIEPPEYVIGLSKFVMYEHRDAARGEPSKPNDLEFNAYPLRRWVTLALSGNPNQLMPLFAPDDKIISIEWPGRELRRHPELVLSREAGPRIVGFLQQKYRSIDDSTSYDRDDAFHALRIGYQGVELLRDGVITVPTPEPARGMFMDVRLGYVSKDSVLGEISRCAAQLVNLRAGGPLSDKPDYDRLNRWLQATYLSWWSARDLWQK